MLIEVLLTIFITVQVLLLLKEKSMTDNTNDSEIIQKDPCTLCRFVRVKVKKK